MKVLTYNVHGWLTPDGNASNVDLLADVSRPPARMWSG